MLNHSGSCCIKRLWSWEWCQLERLGTKSCITDMRRDLTESSGWLFKSLARGGGILWWPHSYRPHSLFVAQWCSVSGTVPKCRVQRAAFWIHGGLRQGQQICGGIPAGSSCQKLGSGDRAAWSWTFLAARRAVLSAVVYVSWLRDLCSQWANLFKNGDQK